MSRLPLALLAASLIALPTAAFHGSPTSCLRGTASLLSEEFPARLCEPDGFVNGAARLTIYEPNTGQPIIDQSLTVRPIAFNVRFEGCLEIIDPYGYESPYAPDVLFRVTGFRHNDLCTGNFEVRLDGHYLAFQLHFEGGSNL